MEPTIEKINETNRTVTLIQIDSDRQVWHEFLEKVNKLGFTAKDKDFTPSPHGNPSAYFLATVANDKGVKKLREKYRISSFGLESVKRVNTGPKRVELTLGEKKGKRGYITENRTGTGEVVIKLDGGEIVIRMGHEYKPTNIQPEPEENPLSSLGTDLNSFLGINRAEVNPLAEYLDNEFDEVENFEVDSIDEANDIYTIDDDEQLLLDEAEDIYSVDSNETLLLDKKSPKAKATGTLKELVGNTYSTNETSEALSPMQQNQGYEVYFAPEFIELRKSGNSIETYEYPVKEGDTGAVMDLEEDENSGIYWGPSYLEFNQNNKLVYFLDLSDMSIVEDVQLQENIYESQFGKRTTDDLYEGEFSSMTEIPYKTPTLGESPIDRGDHSQQVIDKSSLNEVKGDTNTRYHENGKLVIILGNEYDTDEEETLITLLDNQGYEGDGVDYDLIIGMGDDIANAIEIINKEILTNSEIAIFLDSVEGENCYTSDEDLDESVLQEHHLSTDADKIEFILNNQTTALEGGEWDRFELELLAPDLLDKVYVRVEKAMGLIEEVKTIFEQDEEDAEVESNFLDDLKANFRSWEQDCDNEADAETLTSILVGRHPKEDPKKIEDYCYSWVGLEKKNEFDEGHLVRPDGSINTSFEKTGTLPSWNTLEKESEENPNAGFNTTDSIEIQMAKDMFKGLSSEDYFSPNKTDRDRIDSIALQRLQKDGLVDYDTEVDHDDNGRATGGSNFYWFNERGLVEVTSAEELYNNYFY